LNVEKMRALYDEDAKDKLRQEVSTFSISSYAFAGAGLVAVAVGTYFVVSEKKMKTSFKVNDTEISFLPGPGAGLAMGMRF